MKVKIESFTTPLDASIASPVNMQFTTGGGNSGGGTVNLIMSAGGTLSRPFFSTGAVSVGAGVTVPLINATMAYIGGRTLWYLLTVQGITRGANPFSGNPSHPEGQAFFNLSYGIGAGSVYGTNSPLLVQQYQNFPTIPNPATPIILTVQSGFTWVLDIAPFTVTPVGMTLSETALTLSEL